MLIQFKEQEYIPWSTVSVPLAYFRLLCYDINDVIALLQTS